MTPSEELRPEVLAADLEVALDLADRVDALTLPAFAARRFRVDLKENRTEVTEVDRAAEALIVERLAMVRSDHGVFGEEFGQAGDRGSPWQWIVDPIDGTSGFVRRIPVWATLIALEHTTAGLAVAVISAPALGRRWWATRDGGAFTISTLGDDDGTGPRRCSVSEIDRIEQAEVSITHSAGWDALGMTGTLVDLQRRARRSRGFGDFWQHCLVAEGAIDIAVDAVGVARYDLAAVRLLVEEAGGRFTDRNGVATHEHDTAISTNGLLHDAVIDLVATERAAD